MKMKKDLSVKILSTLAAASFLLSSCSPAAVDETTASSEPQATSETTTTAATTSETTTEESTAITSVTYDEDVLLADYNKYCFFDYDHLIPCADDDENAKLLKSVPNVVYVGTYGFYDDNEYMMLFTMPVDHDDLSKGNFIQLVHVIFEGADAPNCFNVGGYDIGPIYEKDSRELNGVSRSFFSKEYKTNYFEPEYRLYGRSRPDGLGKDDDTYWSLLNCRQAAEDFHIMIDSLKQALSGNWCFEGHSKGGEAANYQAAVHPEDADMFLSEAGMVLLGNGDKDLYEYAYTTAGDLALGKKKAAKYRKDLTDFQIELLKNREVLAPMLWEQTKQYSCKFTEDMNQDILFDLIVLDQVYFWQTCFPWEKEMIDKVMKLKDAKTDEEKAEYYKTVIDTLFELYSPWQYELYDDSEMHQEMGLYNYLFQSFHEDGHYGYDFSYLRKEIEKSGTDAKLYVTEDMEDGLWDIRISKDHREKFPYDPSVLNARKDAIENTEKPLFFVNGLSDIFNTHEVKESDNENVYIFNIPEAFHSNATPEFLSKEQKTEFDELVKKFMALKD